MRFNKSSKHLKSKKEKIKDFLKNSLKYVLLFHEKNSGGEKLLYYAFKATLEYYYNP